MSRFDVDYVAKLHGLRPWEFDPRIPTPRRFSWTRLVWWWRLR